LITPHPNPLPSRGEGISSVINGRKNFELGLVEEDLKKGY
jgi:hypothetical protein